MRLICRVGLATPGLHDHDVHDTVMIKRHHMCSVNNFVQLKQPKHSGNHHNIQPKLTISLKTKQPGVQI